MLAALCSKFVDNLGQAVRTQLVDGLLADLLQDVRFLRMYSNWLLTACISLVGTTCSKSVTIVNIITR